MVYAEDLPYWQTSNSSADTWIDRACREIVAAGGTIKAEGYGRDEHDCAGYFLRFTFGADEFRIAWPVMPSRRANQRAARVQAATMLYHDVKAKCVSAKVHGMRASFLQYYLLPDGRTAAQATGDQLLGLLPKLLPGV